MAHDCRQTQHRFEREKEKAEVPRKPRKDLKDIECYNRHQKGHYYSNCPSNALFCREKSPRVGVKQSPELKRSGAVEGTTVDNILLDSGCSRTLVSQELVPRSKMLEGEAVAIRCAHGDTVLYPLALVQMVVDGRNMEVKAAMSENLPMEILLRTDVPDLPKLLNQESTGRKSWPMPWRWSLELKESGNSARRSRLSRGSWSQEPVVLGWRMTSGCPQLMRNCSREVEVECGRPGARSKWKDRPMPGRQLLQRSHWNLVGRSD